MPLSTYRVQLHAGFKLAQLHQQLDYLKALGIDWIYASPVFAAVPGSTHGYDQTDPTKLNPELGTRADWYALHERRRELGLGWLQDIVPNHMAYSLHNPWVRELLKHGEASTVAKHFDVDWRHPDFKGRIMMPILGDDLAACIERGEVRLSAEADAILVYDQVLPLSSRSRGRFADLRAAPLAEVLAAQHYALTHWKDASERINYRRFFTVNGLICLRAERKETFDATHALVIEWLEASDIDGVRVDHVDGLLDPTGYLKRLREVLGPDAFIAVEKILEHGERLPESWPIEGTSGYDFIAYTGQLLRHPRGDARVREIARLYTVDITDADRDVNQQVYDNKLMFLRTRMAGELDNLVHHARGALAGLPLGMDAGLLRETVAEWLAGFPVYRAYIRFGSFREGDRRLLVGAIDRALGFGAIQEHGLGLLRAWLRSITKLDDRTARFLQRSMQLSGPLMAKGIEDTTFYRHVDYLANNEVGDHPDVAHALDVEGWHDRMAERCLSDMNAGSTHDTKRGEDARARLHTISAAPEAWAAFAKTANDALEAGQLTLPGDVFLMLLQSFVGAWPSRFGRGIEDQDGFVSRMSAFAVKALREGKRHGSWAEPNVELEQRCGRVVQYWLGHTGFAEALQTFDEVVCQQAYLNAIRGLVLRCTSPGLPDVYQGSEYGDYSLVDPDNRRPVDYPARGLSLGAGAGLPPWSLFRPVKDRFEFDSGKQRLLQCLLLMRREQPELWQRGEYVPVVVRGGGEEVLAYRRVYGDDQALVVLSIRSDLTSRWPHGRDFSGASVSLPRLGRRRDVLTSRVLVFGEQTGVDEMLASGPAAVFVAEE